MKIEHYESARTGLVPVTKILSSTYCILIIAIYVVIVVNRFTQISPQSHHDVEVSSQTSSLCHHLLSAELSDHLPDGGLQHVPVVPPDIPHQAAPLPPEQKISRQRFLETRCRGVRSWFSSLLPLPPGNSRPGYRVFWRGGDRPDCHRDPHNLSLHPAGEH